MNRRFDLPEPAPAGFFARAKSYLWLVVGTVSIGSFIGQVDASIVQLALPSLETSFHTRLSTVSWVAVAYMLAFACALPVFARIAEIAGRKTLYLAGFALFGLFSALCGLAPTLGSLIAFRVAQGAAGALLGANSVVIIVAAAGPARRSELLGVMAAAQAVGLGVGPALGGLILGALDWRWIFWITVPFAILAFLLGWFILPKTVQFAKDRRFDSVGALLLTPALAAILIAISEGRAWGLTPLLIACLVGGPLLLAVFIWRETRTEAPLIDLKMFRSPAFSAGGLGVAISYAMLYGLFFVMAFVLVRGYRDPPMLAGLRLTVVPAALGLVAPFAGAASDKHPRLIMLTGMAFCGLAALALAWTTTQGSGDLVAVMVELAVFGAGLGLYIAPNNSATIGAAPAEKSGVAGGLLNLLRVLGSAAGVAVSAALVGWRLEGVIGPGQTTADAPTSALLDATAVVLLTLAALAVFGAAAALVRDRPASAN